MTNDYFPIWLYSPELIRHTISSMVIGFLVVTLDFLIFRQYGKSFLKLRYDSDKIYILFLTWGIGAGIGGFIGGLSGILTLTPQGSLAAGISWPAVLPRLLASATIDEDIEAETPDIELDDD